MQDYRAWRALGPGGLPSAPLGWSVATALRTLSRDTLSAAGDPASAPDGWTLPDRVRRPAMAPYPVPYRQLDQIPGADVIDELVARADAVGREPGNRLAHSRFERHHDSVVVDEPGTPWARRAAGEVAHVHPGQGSPHVVAAPADVVTIAGAALGRTTSPRRPAPPRAPRRIPLPVLPTRRGRARHRPAHRRAGRRHRPLTGRVPS